MLLAEDLLLLLTDDATGKKKLSREFLELLLAGAVLAELADAGLARVTEQGEHIRRNRVVAERGLTPPADEVLAAGYGVLLGKEHWRPAGAIQKMSKHLLDALYERLARAELVRRDEAHALGFIRLTRWPAVDTAYEQKLLEGLDQVLLFGGEPDDRTASLIGLLQAGGVLIQVMDRNRKIDRRATNRRAKTIAENYWTVNAAGKAIQELQGAIAAAASAGAAG